MEAAFDTLPGPVERIDVAVPDLHGVFVRKRDLAVQAVSAQVHEPAAGCVHPFLEPVVHVPRPVFRVSGGDQHPVPVQGQRAVVELRLGVEIVVESLPLHPGQEPPLRGGDVTGRAAADHVGGHHVLGDVVDGLGPVEGERRVVVRAVHPVRWIRVPFQVVPGVDRGGRRKLVRVDVVAAPPEVVVGVPVDVGGQHGYVGRRRGRRDNPGEGKESAGLRGSVEIIQAGPFRRLDVLFVGGIRVTLGVPLHAGPRVIAVGRDLHRGAGAVLVVPADVPDVFLLLAVVVKFQLVGLHGVHAELGSLAGPDPLGPHVAQQAVPQQAEMVGPVPARRHVYTLVAEIPPRQSDFVLPAGRHVRVDRPRGPGACLDGFTVDFEFEQDIGNGDVPLVADVPY